MKTYRFVLGIGGASIDNILAMYKVMKAYRKQTLYRFRIGSANDEVLEQLDPKGLSFKERLRCLWLAHELGFETSVFIDPMMDNSPDAVVEAVKPYVTEAIWLGKAKSLKHFLTVYPGPNNKRRVAKADKLLKLQSAVNLKVIHKRLKRDPKVRWGKTIQKAIGLKRSK